MRYSAIHLQMGRENCLTWGVWQQTMLDIFNANSELVGSDKSKDATRSPATGTGFFSGALVSLVASSGRGGSSGPVWSGLALTEWLAGSEEASSTEEKKNPCVLALVRLLRCAWRQQPWAGLFPRPLMKRLWVIALGKDHNLWLSIDQSISVYWFYRREIYTFVSRNRT